MSIPFNEKITIRFLQAYEVVKTVYQIKSINEQQNPEVTEELLQEMIESYNVSPLWLLTGRGLMFVFEQQVKIYNYGNMVYASTVQGNVTQEQF